ncbi:CBS domain-containing protein [Haladaptatus litoreus]|uniref:hypothetical protein n=1 Tax=Haladaptatus litoreus TaxID=553468 RepID=UPI00097100F3|nr:hypothetical protein [Haladaptatus litoreus]
MPDTPITETAQIMRDRTVGSVLTIEDELVSVVTDWDIADGGSTSLTRKSTDLEMPLHRT